MRTICQYHLAIAHTQQLLCRGAKSVHPPDSLCTYHHKLHLSQGVRQLNRHVEDTGHQNLPGERHFEKECDQHVVDVTLRAAVTAAEASAEEGCECSKTHLKL